MGTNYSFPQKWLCWLCHFWMNFDKWMNEYFRDISSSLGNTRPMVPKDLHANFGSSHSSQKQVTRVFFFLIIVFISGPHSLWFDFAHLTEIKMMKWTHHIPFEGKKIKDSCVQQNRWFPSTFQFLRSGLTSPLNPAMRVQGGKFHKVFEICYKLEGFCVLSRT